MPKVVWIRTKLHRAYPPRFDSSLHEVPIESLTTEQWQQVYLNNNLLRGKSITNTGKFTSQFPAFVFKSGANTPNYIVDLQSYQVEPNPMPASNSRRLALGDGAQAWVQEYS